MDSAALSVLMVGMGPVVTTMMAGCILARERVARPIGSLVVARTRGGRAWHGLDVARLDQVVFGGWDEFLEDAEDRVRFDGVVPPALVDRIEGTLGAISPRPIVRFPEHMTDRAGSHVRTVGSKLAAVEAVRNDVRDLLRDHGTKRAVALLTDDDEVVPPRTDAHGSLTAFEAGLRNSADEITGLQITAYALLKEGVPVADLSSRGVLEVPALQELAARANVPVAGCELCGPDDELLDALAHAVSHLELDVGGWLSSAIWGDRGRETDGERIDEARRTAIRELLGATPAPDGSFRSTMTHAEYGGLGGGRREQQDRIEARGWVGAPATVSLALALSNPALVAPRLLDVALLLDVASRAGLTGPQAWLGYFFRRSLGPEAQPALPARFERLDQRVRALVQTRAPRTTD
jgi:myo-inositol-1-phosphate synthase